MGETCGVATVSVGVHSSPRITFSPSVYNERRPGIQSAGTSPPLGSSGSSTPDRPSTGKGFMSPFGSKKAATFSEFDRGSPKIRKARSASKLATSFFRKQASIFPSFGRSSSSPNDTPNSSDVESKEKKKAKKSEKKQLAKGSGEKRALSDGEKTATNSPELKKDKSKEPATPKRTAASMAKMTVSSSVSSPVARPAPKPAKPESPVKRVRSQKNAKTLPMRFQQCETSDLVVLVADMLGELVRLNDGIPLTGRGLTRFHSRAPPMISIEDYLQRLALHLTLQPSILLAMVYYIDILSKHYPPFTISSLTVHRFLITAATVATKGLCDSFLTNTFYARVGGVSLMELNMLELEFLVRVGWKIVPKPELLQDYYTNLVKRLEERFQIGTEAVGKSVPCTLTSPDTLAEFDEKDVIIPEDYMEPDEVTLVATGSEVDKAEDAPAP